MNKVAHYLQQHMVGEVLTSPSVLEHYATDESIFRLQPMLVVHPRHESDLRKATRFSWQLAERGRVVPITARGKGTDQTGAALGAGVVLSLPAHMNKVIELDPKTGSVTAQAGMNAASLQQTLFTHGRFLPSFAPAFEYTTVGGAVGNNEAGPTAYKYGPIKEFVKAMRVVLANGEVIETKRLSKRELGKKQGLSSFEGHIYRELDKLIEEASPEIDGLESVGDRSNVGYNIADVKLKDGSFDLTPLLVGSQGTLGVISEVTFAALPHTPSSKLLIAAYNDISAAFQTVVKINGYKKGPESIDFLDFSTMQHALNTNANLYKDTFGNQIPAIALFIEVNDASSRSSKRMLKNIEKLINQSGGTAVKVEDEHKDKWQAARDSASLFIAHQNGRASAIPLINDAYVPVERCAEFMRLAQELVATHVERPFAFWGQAGSGVIHAYPLFDIAEVGERQRMFKLLDAYYDLVVQAGGSIAASSAEGRLRGLVVGKTLQPRQIELMSAIKNVFDPYKILNPGVKVDVDFNEVRKMIRTDYGLTDQHAHLPRR